MALPIVAAKERLRDERIRFRDQQVRLIRPHRVADQQLRRRADARAQSREPEVDEEAGLQDVEEVMLADHG